MGSLVLAVLYDTNLLSICAFEPSTDSRPEKHVEMKEHRRMNATADKLADRRQLIEREVADEGFGVGLVFRV